MRQGNNCISTNHIQSKILFSYLYLDCNFTLWHSLHQPLAKILFRRFSFRFFFFSFPEVCCITFLPLRNSHCIYVAFGRFADKMMKKLMFHWGLFSSPHEFFIIHLWWHQYVDTKLLIFQTTNESAFHKSIDSIEKRFIRLRRISFIMCKSEVVLSNRAILL